MNTNKPKENENPILYAVKNDGSSTKDVQKLQALLDNEGGVRRALLDAAQWNRDTVSLFQSVLESNPKEQTQFLFEPVDFSAFQGTPLLDETQSLRKATSKKELQKKAKNSAKPIQKRTNKEPITEEEIFEWIRHIQDPEHPHSLEELGVLQLHQVQLSESSRRQQLQVYFTPTIPHCSMATLIGLCVSVQLRRVYPHIPTTVCIQPGSHVSEHAINKQLQDKERRCAALENPHLLRIVNTCLGNGQTRNYQSNVMM